MKLLSATIFALFLSLNVSAQFGGQMPPPPPPPGGDLQSGFWDHFFDPNFWSLLDEANDSGDWSDFADQYPDAVEDMLNSDFTPEDVKDEIWEDLDPDEQSVFCNVYPGNPICVPLPIFLQILLILSALILGFKYYYPKQLSKNDSFQNAF